MIPSLQKNKILFDYLPILLVSILAISILIIGCTSTTTIPQNQVEPSGIPIPQKASAKTLQKTADVLSVSIDLGSGSTQSLETFSYILRVSLWGIDCIPQKNHESVVAY